MNMRVKVFLFSLLITIIKIFFLVPINYYGGITGGYAGFGYITLFRLLSPKNFIYSLIIDRFVLEIFITFVISFIIVVFFCKLFDKIKK